MTPHRILQLNAASTAAFAIGLLATRNILPSFFGLDSPMLLDILAIALLAYAAALAIAAHRRPVARQTLLLFTAADVLWVVGSALVLLLFWGQLAGLARFLIITGALGVEVFATLQFREAGRAVGAARES